MKRALLSLITLSALFLSVSLHAQIYMTSAVSNTDFGIKAGGNFQNISGAVFNSSYSPGYVAGLYVGKRWKKVALHLEALASSGSYTTLKPAVAPLSEGQIKQLKDTTSKGDFSSTYISVPLVLEIKLYKKLFLELGPQYNYMLSITDNNGAYTKAFKKDNLFKTGEACFDIGINADIARKFNLGLRYVVGLTNVNNDKYFHEYDSWTENSIQLALSYKIRK